MITQDTLRPSVMALALVSALAALGAGNALAEESAGGLDASASIGVGAVSGDRTSRGLFGQYNGLRAHEQVGLFNFDYARRSEEAGTLARFWGNNVLGETRELGMLWKKQGDWRFAVEYGQLVRYDPNTINTGMTGVGTTTPGVSVLSGGPGSGSTIELHTKRTGLGLSFAKRLSPSLGFEASVNTENKTGARMSGIGMTCPSTVAPGCVGSTGLNTGSAVLMLPEPIDSNHTQFDARLNYAGEKFRISGGYYGSLYNNTFGSMTPGIPGALNNPVGVPLGLNTGLQTLLSRSIALAPDNQAHHFDVSGNYLYSPTTRVSFKLGYAEASQRQSFAGAGFTDGPTGVNNLHGKVVTTLAQVGFSSRPVAKLALTGDLRYENRDDRTGLAYYNLEGTTGYTNMRLPNLKLRGKLQASYQLGGGFTGVMGTDYESIDRASFTPTSAVRGITALRQKTDEVGWRAELRKQMSETFSGSISFVSSRRNGSSWLGANSGTGVTPIPDVSSGLYSTAVFMPTLANRQRDKLRLFGTWQPTDELSVQFSVEDGQDRYSSPSQYGLQATRMGLYSIDANYVLSEAWTINAYASQSNQKLAQARSGGYNPMLFDNRSSGLGLGVVGKPTDALNVGGGITLLNDRSSYSQSADASGYAANSALLASTGGLPDVSFRRAEFRMFGRYAMEKGGAVRLDLIHQHYRFNDWAWGYNGVPFTYSDNTTVSQQFRQHVTYMGVSYVLTWK